mmetsp:Transcript_226/g.411  ORF Transcript_226/g.411 Transcript_226/m.411 type:complete len:275 (-) Transcript_226:371-1195(-)
MGSTSRYCAWPSSKLEELKVEFEVAKLIGLVACRLGEPIACLVGVGDDGEGHRDVGETAAARAPIVLDVDVQVVVVLNVLGVAGGRHVGKHEHLLGRPLHLLLAREHALALLGLHGVGSVLDARQVELEAPLDLARRIGLYDLERLALDHVARELSPLPEPTSNMAQPQLLGDLELDLADVQLALGVVDLHEGVGLLVVEEYVLVEEDGHLGLALVLAAARADLADHGGVGVLLEFDGGLVNDQHLLVLHHLAVKHLDRALDTVLHLGLGPVPG